MKFEVDTTRGEVNTRHEYVYLAIISAYYDIRGLIRNGRPGESRQNHGCMTSSSCSQRFTIYPLASLASQRQFRFPKTPALPHRPFHFCARSRARVTMCIGPRSRKASLPRLLDDRRYFNGFDYLFVRPAFVSVVSRQLANSRSGSRSILPPNFEEQISNEPVLLLFHCPSE